ncbi:MAG TPA: toll/interleukin-1 receptor domain-containing protein [Azospirillum sp.]
MKVFISYSHKDKRLRDSLEDHLAPLRRLRGTDVWTDRALLAGDVIDEEIRRQLTTADVVVLIVSQHFFKSNYCYDIELKEAMRRHAAGEARVVPVIVRPVDLWYEATFGKLLAVPEDGKPVTEWRNRDRAWTQVAAEIRRNIEEQEARSKPKHDGGCTPVHLPWPENPYFQDPHDLLGRIAESLNAGGTAVVTHGMGGVGKTQAALHYAHRARDRYRVVWWVEAETSAGRDLGYQTLAKALSLPEADAREAAATRAAVRDWLARNDGWLLVFDNAEDAASLKDWLPVRPAGHALISSRSPHWGRMATRIPLDHWSEADSAAFLLARTGSADRAGAEALAKDLDGLALALEQAAAYIESTGCGFAEYRRLFERRFAALAAQGKPEDYPATLLTTWDVSLTAAEAACPAASDLLRLLAFFAPDDIPRTLFTEHGKELPESLAPLADEVTFNDAVAALQRQALLKAEPDSLSLHRLVQRVTRSRIDDPVLWVNAGIRLVNAAFPFDGDDVRFWPTCVRLRPHAEALLVRIDDGCIEKNHAGRLLNQLGFFLRHRAELPAAKRHCERAVQIGEIALGQDHPAVATFIDNLASVMQSLGDLKGAREGFERALRISETAYGPEHTTVATRVNNLASVLRDLGDLTGARAGFERALRIGEVADGSDHPSMAVRISNLAVVLHDLGDLTGARDGHERALRIDEAAYGQNHPFLAIRINNLACVLLDLGDLKGARAGYERALAILETTLGPDHPNTTIARHNLANCPPPPAEP